MGILNRSKLEKLAELDSTKEGAEERLKRTLPYPEGHDAYASFKFLKVKKVSGKIGSNVVSYLAVCEYRLKEEYQNKVQQHGTGAYKSPLEDAIERREDSL